MTRTRPLWLVVFALLAGAAGWLLELALVATGAAALVPSYTLAFALVVIGALVVIFALPVRRAVRSQGRQTVDPFYAARVVVLAKACSIAGALLGGAAVGIILFFLTRSVVAGVGSMATSIVTAIAALILLVCGLVAEYLCSIPPEDRDKGDESPATTRPL